MPSYRSRHNRIKLPVRPDDNPIVGEPTYNDTRRWVLEDGSGFWKLENGTGYWIIEPGSPGQPLFTEDGRKLLTESGDPLLTG